MEQSEGFTSKTLAAAGDRAVERQRVVLVSVGMNVGAFEPEGMFTRVMGVLASLGDVLAWEQSMGEWEGKPERTMHAAVRLHDHTAAQFRYAMHAASFLLEQDCIALRPIGEDGPVKHALLYWAAGLVSQGGTLQEFPMPEGVVRTATLHAE